MTNACAAALAALQLKRPVRIFNSRSADMQLLGGREEWLADYTAGFDATGKLLGVRFSFAVDCGAAPGDTEGSLYMGMHWAGNAYYIPAYAATAALYRTATPARTSMRAPGVLQTCLATELVLERVAATLNLPLASVQAVNLLAAGQSTVTGQKLAADGGLLPQELWQRASMRSRYEARLAAAQAFNAGSRWVKRGVAMVSSACKDWCYCCKYA